jgi:hypothetical protein
MTKRCIPGVGLRGPYGAVSTGRLMCTRFRDADDDASVPTALCIKMMLLMMMMMMMMTMMMMMIIMIIILCSKG